MDARAAESRASPPAAPVRPAPEVAVQGEQPRDGIDLKLHIGGEQVKEGWKILNAQPKQGVDYVRPPCNSCVRKAQPIVRVQVGNICDLSQIYASHVFEHVPQALVPPTLAGMHRILKHGGTLMLSVPDMDVLCRLFTHPGGSFDNRMHVMRMMFGGQTDAFDFHYFGWSWEFMQQYLQAAGFSSCQRVESFGLFQDTSDYAPYGGSISLNVLATK